MSDTTNTTNTTNTNTMNTNTTGTKPVKAKAAKAAARTKKAPRRVLRHAAEKDYEVRVLQGRPVRIVDMKDGALSSAETVALSAVTTAEAVKAARKGLRPGKHRVDLTVRVSGDIQIEADYERTDRRLDAERLLRALAEAEVRAACRDDMFSPTDAEVAKLTAARMEELRPAFLNTHTSTCSGRVIPHLVINRADGAFQTIGG